MSDELRDELSGEMRKHFLDPKNMNYCVCDEWSDDEMSEDWDEHLADAIMPLVARERAAAKQEALKEAADAWLHGAWGNTPRKADRVADRMAASQYAGDWLKARAASIETGSDHA
jgi:hypothetical protein